MDQSFDAILDASRSPEGSDLRNDAGDDLTRCIALLDGCPGVNFRTLNRECDFLFLFVDTEDLDFDLLTDMEHFTGMVDAAPSELANVDQSVRASQVDKGAKVGQVTDDALAYLARFELIEQFFAAALAPFLDSEALGEDQAIARPIDLDYFELELFVFHALEFGGSFLVFSTGSDFFALEVENLG